MNTNHITELLEFIYGETGAKKILSPLMELLGAFKKEHVPAAGTARGAITHKDALLISYGDMISAPAETSGEPVKPDGAAGADGTALARLGRFLAAWNKSTFSYLHLLPFHPYSSDDGFSVIDYRKVDPRLGDWDDIEELGKRFKMTFDFVINHGSVQSEWFKKFIAGEEKFRNWYITRPENYDWSAVVRPRTHPLLTPFTKSDGSKTLVWTTFSADQVDYDFSQPEVLLEFIRIFLDYSRRGGRMLRLDAIAYLWKEDGTPCLHHPKTHAVVKLLRAIIDYLGLEMLILTETNVPHKENISYFGGSGAGESGSAGDTAGGAEAHMVYNFALPPLVLHAAISGDAGPLRAWAAALPALGEGNCFLNFLASHDGVGLTPAKGLIEDTAFAQTLEEAQKRGALISMKSTPAGPVPYELNCSWADMTAPQNMDPPETQAQGALIAARAFLTTYAVPLALPGLPAVYFHSWTGSRAWKEGPEKLGYNRAINREKPAIDLIEKELADPLSFRSLVLRGFEKLMEFRAAEAAFNPGVPCKVLAGAGAKGTDCGARGTDCGARGMDCGARGMDCGGIFALYRGQESSGARGMDCGVICIQNFSPAEVQFDPGIASLGEISVPGHGLCWLAFDSGGIRRELVI